MANVLRDQGRFFSLPAEFVESGCLRDLSPSAVKLYVALYYFGQKHSAVRLEFSNAELQSQTGLDTKSIQTARKLLCDQNLVRTLKGALGVYTYTLLNQKTGEALPAPQGRTGIRRYHSAPRQHPERQSETIPSTQPTRLSKPSDTLSRQNTPVSFRCFSCKGTESWSRGTDQLCVRCHPDPQSPLRRARTSSLTAAEVGF